MYAQFTPIHQLVFTLSLLDTPYSPYLRGISIWDTTLTEEEEFLKEISLQDPYLNKLLCIGKGAEKNSPELNNHLREYYFKHIVDDYGTTYKYLKTLLFFLLGYDLDNHETIFERTKKYDDQLRFPTFFLDTLVEKERFDSYLETSKNDVFAVMGKMLENNNLKGFLHIVRFLNTISLNQTRYENTHYHSKTINNSLFEEYKPKDTLTELKNLYQDIRSATGQQMPCEVAREISNLELCDLQEMFKLYDSNNIANRLLTGNPTNLVTLIEFILIIGAIPSQQ